MPLAGEPMAVDAAVGRGGDQHRSPVMRDADAVRKVKAPDDFLRLSSRRVVAQHTAVRATLDDLGRIVGRFIARRAVAEIDLSIGRDVEIVGHSHA